MLERLAGLPNLKELAGRKIFDALIQMQRSGSPFSLHELEGRIGEQENTLLAGLAFADDMEEEDMLKQALACVEELSQRAGRGHLVDLKTAIAKAERAGDMAMALELMQELKRHSQRGQ